jgi:uncharacterized protein YkwD
MVNTRAVMTAAAIFVALLTPASQAQASGLSYAVATTPTGTGTPGAFTDTVIAVASANGPMTVDITALAGARITRADDLDCAVTPTGEHCAFTAEAAVANMIGFSGTYTGPGVHLRLSASDVNGPVRFAGDETYPVTAAGASTPPVAPRPSGAVSPVSVSPVPVSPVAKTATKASAGTTTATSAASAHRAAAKAARLKHRRTRVIFFTNAERAAAGLTPLHASPALTTSAQAYARRLATDGVFSHTDGSLLTDRIAGAGYHFRFVGENLGMGQPSAKAIVAAWMSSPEHRTNMLDPRFTDIGVGVAPRSDGQIVWCIDLGWPGAK